MPNAHLWLLMVWKRSGGKKKRKRREGESSKLEDGTLKAW